CARRARLAARAGRRKPRWIGPRGALHPGHDGGGERGGRGHREAMGTRPVHARLLRPRRDARIVLTCLAIACERAVATGDTGATRAAGADRALRRWAWRWDRVIRSMCPRRKLTVGGIGPRA